MPVAYDRPSGHEHISDRSPVRAPDQLSCDIAETRPAPTIGSVHDVKPDSIEIYIENGGDFSIPRSAVREVHFNKVILDGRKLSKEVHDAIGRAHSAEDNEDHEETDE